MLRTLLLVLSALTLVGTATPSRAASPSAFAPVVFRVRLLDRHEQPVAGVAVRLSADMDGVTPDSEGDPQEFAERVSGVAVTDAHGMALFDAVWPARDGDALVRRAG